MAETGENDMTDPDREVGAQEDIDLGREADPEKDTEIVTIKTRDRCPHLERTGAYPIAKAYESRYNLERSKVTMMTGTEDGVVGAQRSTATELREEKDVHHHHQVLVVHVIALNLGQS